MIAYLKGAVISKLERHIVIVVNNVGYKVGLTQTTLTKVSVGDEISVHTHLHMTDDLLDLYGFSNQAELLLFKHLISVAGVGPKSAMNILDLGKPEEIVSAISQEQVQYVSRASGIGPKSAKKIILELQNKVWDMQGILPKVHLQGHDEVIAGLQVLGYQIPQIQDALKQIPKDIADVQGKVKAALQILGRK